MKEFVTAVKEAAKDEAEERGYQFKVDGRVLTCYKPTESQFAIYVASTSRHASVEQKIAGVIDFFVNVLDQPSHAYLVDKLMDRNDPFGLAEIEQIVYWMIEEWSGRPTEPASVSTGSQESTGGSSTEPTPESTSFDSHPTGSATSSTPGSGKGSPKKKTSHSSTTT